MSGACVEVQGDASGGRVEVSSCGAQQPANQRWLLPSGVSGTVTGQIVSASHPDECIDNGDVPPPPGTDGACAKLASAWGIDGPAVQLANPTSNGAPCEAANAPSPEEAITLGADGVLHVGALCAAGRRGAPTPFGPLQLWAKPLAGGAAAVLLAYRGSGAPATVAVALATVPGLDPGARFVVTDLWTKTVLPVAGGAFNLSVTAGESQIVSVRPS